jgi:UDP-N-acetylglucosamine 2-epimerase (non-hydrolysing)
MEARKMKIMTILGTRPEIIRLSCIIPKLDKLCDHVLVHTGQNYDANLNDLFFSQLNLREVLSGNRWRRFWWKASG